jgi:hypothetical protein
MIFLISCSGMEQEISAVDSIVFDVSITMKKTKDSVRDGKKNKKSYSVPVHEQRASDRNMTNKRT